MCENCRRQALMISVDRSEHQTKNTWSWYTPRMDYDYLATLLGQWEETTELRYNGYTWWDWIEDPDLKNIRGKGCNICFLSRFQHCASTDIRMRTVTAQLQGSEPFPLLFHSILYHILWKTSSWSKYILTVKEKLGVVWFKQQKSISVGDYKILLAIMETVLFNKQNDVQVNIFR